MRRDRGALSAVATAAALLALALLAGGSSRSSSSSSSSSSGGWSPVTGVAAATMSCCAGQFSCGDDKQPTSTGQVDGGRVCCFGGAGLRTTSANGVNVCFCDYTGAQPICPTPCNTPTNPCRNGGTCSVVGSTGTACSCAPGFSGPTCAVAPSSTGAFGNSTGNGTFTDAGLTADDDGATVSNGSIVGFVLVLVGAALLAGAIVFLNSRWPHARNLAFATLVLTLFDFITDSLFCAQLARDGDAFVSHYVAALFFLCLNVTVNSALVGWFLWVEFRDPAFHAWLKAGHNQLGPLTGVALLSCWNVDCLRTLDSALFDALAFRAPLSDYTTARLLMAGLATTAVENLPQLCIQLAVIERTGRWDTLTTLTFLASVLSIVFGGTKRVFACCLFRGPDHNAKSDSKKAAGAATKQPPKRLEDDASATATSTSAGATVAAGTAAGTAATPASPTSSNALNPAGGAVASDDTAATGAAADDDQPGSSPQSGNSKRPTPAAGAVARAPPKAPVALTSVKVQLPPAPPTRATPAAAASPKAAPPLPRLPSAKAATATPTASRGPVPPPPRRAIPTPAAQADTAAADRA